MTTPEAYQHLLYALELLKEHDRLIKKDKETRDMTDVERARLFFIVHQLELIFEEHWTEMESIAAMILGEKHDRK